MSKKVIAWDLGTSGNKASLYDSDGVCIAAEFSPYDTSYPKSGWHEQNPNDWWDAVVSSTQKLVKKSGADIQDIYACGISGHSLGVVPIDKSGQLLTTSIPIWSDSRAVHESRRVFETLNEIHWYMTTGNGFLPQLYSAFKILWYKENEPELFNSVDKFIGTKDYINYKLTGRILTDCSYASGSGVWDLQKWEYSQELLDAMGLEGELFPEAVKSTEVIGQISKSSASELGLSPQTYVISGGVDNSCMALGSKAFREGRLYNALGSSSWIVVSSKQPILEPTVRPFVFAHVVPDFFVSALSIGSSGTSFSWIKDQLAKEFILEAEASNEDVYDLLLNEAAKSPIGANKLLFNPSLGGGMPLDLSDNIRGAYIGLDLTHTKADIIRSAIEGITLGLGMRLDVFRKLAQTGNEILVMGGGSRSKFWRQIYADVYDMQILKSSIDQQAAALGAAACALVGSGIWKNFDVIDELHVIEDRTTPIPENVEKYRKLMGVFKDTTRRLAELGDMMSEIEL